jgi:hypothetical protein
LIPDTEELMAMNYTLRQLKGELAALRNRIDRARVASGVEVLRIARTNPHGSSMASRRQAEHCAVNKAMSALLTPEETSQ